MIIDIKISKNIITIFINTNLSAIFGQMLILVSKNLEKIDKLAKLKQKL